ncbi:protein-lysine N-methyltransferase EEF2KMT isoform X2 [Ovis aries]|nr:protein-lysine N-methyltransferase EEF2KMT isoform X2 [Ovis aries]
MLGPAPSPTPAPCARLEPPRITALLPLSLPGNAAAPPHHGAGGESGCRAPAVGFRAPLLGGARPALLPLAGGRQGARKSLEEKLRDSSGSELLLDILQKTVKHPLCVKHPPSVKYSRSFLSELIRKHEAVHTEPSDELYQALAEVLTAEEPTHCHRSYLLPSGDSVTLCESTAIVSHGTTGLVTWNAALYLAEWAVENPAVFTHRTALELGSGAGLTGLAICKTCRPRAYVFSDCHSRVLEQLRGNVLLNGFSLEPSIDAWAQHPGPHTPEAERPRVAVAQLDWDTVTAPQLAAFQPDVILAAGRSQLCPARHAMNRTGPRRQTSGTSLSQATAQRPDFTSLSSSLREASHPEQR